MSKNNGAAIEMTRVSSGSGSRAGERSPERRALAEAITARDAAAEVLANAVKRHGEVSGRLGRERAEAQRLAGIEVKDDDDYVTPEDAEAWGITGKDFEEATTRRVRKREPVDYSDIDALVRGATEAREKLNVVEAAIGVLEKAAKSRAVDVEEAEQKVGHAERAVANCARLVLATGFGPLLDGLKEMQAEVSRRRFALKFLIWNAVKLNGAGGSDEATRARALLCDGLLPSVDTSPPNCDGTEDEWQETLEALVRGDADAELPS